MSDQQSALDDIPLEIAERLQREALLWQAMSPQQRQAETSRKFERLSPPLFAQRVRKFEAMDLSDLGGQEIIERFNQVLSLDFADGGETSAVIPTMTRTIPEGTAFWRARKLRPHAEKPHLEQISNEDALREPPAEWVGTFRFNRANEPRLYVCVGSPEATFAEIGAEPDELICVARFVSTEPLNVSTIGDDESTQGLSQAARYSAKLINRFIRSQLYRQAAKGDLKTYELTSMIAREYFDLPEEMQDGILYGSIAYPEATNVALRPQAGRKKLRFAGALMVKPQSVRKPVRTSPLAFTDGSLGHSGSFDWYECSGNPWQPLFPEIGPRIDGHL